MNKILIVDVSDSDRRLMVGLLTRAGYEPIAVETMETAKDEVEKLPPGAVNVTAMKFTRGTALYPRRPKRNSKIRIKSPADIPSAGVIFILV